LTINSPENAQQILSVYDGTSPPNVDLKLNISWASDVQEKFEGAHISQPAARCSAAGQAARTANSRHVLSSGQGRRTFFTVMSFMSCRPCD
jgi:hypothetical protein